MTEPRRINGIELEENIAQDRPRWIFERNGGITIIPKGEEPLKTP